MTRPTHLVLNWSNLRHNYAQARALADGKTYAVVKANAYGHGMLACAKALPEADGFAVACVDEAQLLREGGITQPILVLQGAYDAGEWQKACELNVQLVLHHEKQLQDRQQAKLNQPVQVFLKINSGMNRVGFTLDQVDAVLAQLAEDSQLQLQTVMTHFSSADEPDSPAFGAQLSYMASRAWPAPLCLSNSAALYRSRPLKDSISRPGIMLYGASPLLEKSAAELGLKPVLSLRSKLISTHLVPKGEGVGYGGDWRAAKDSRIGVVAIGYGDGYPRHAPHGLPVWVAGKICPLIGRVSMDMITVDLTDHPDAQIGSEVELWGEHISVDTIASQCRTISYELLCKITPRVKRLEHTQA